MEAIRPATHLKLTVTQPPLHGRLQSPFKLMQVLPIHCEDLPRRAQTPQQPVHPLTAEIESPAHLAKQPESQMIDVPFLV